MSLSGARESQPDQTPPWVSRAPPHDLRACGRQDALPEFTRKNQKKGAQGAPVLRWERAWQEARSGQGPDCPSLLSAGRPRAHPRIPMPPNLSSQAFSIFLKPLYPLLSIPHSQQMLLRTPDAHDALRAAAAPCCAPLSEEPEDSA